MIKTTFFFSSGNSFCSTWDPGNTLESPHANRAGGCPYAEVAEVKTWLKHRVDFEKESRLVCFEQIFLKLLLPYTNFLILAE